MRPFRICKTGLNILICGFTPDKPPPALRHVTNFLLGEKEAVINRTNNLLEPLWQTGKNVALIAGYCSM